MRIIEREDVMRSHGLTVGELKKFIEEKNIPDYAPILVQRVEDLYYDYNNWGVYMKEGYECSIRRKHNKDVESGLYSDKNQYPDVREEHLRLFTEEEIQECRSQYSNVHSYVSYADDLDILFLDLHY